MPRSHALILGPLVLAAFVSAGCGESDSFMPPPRPDLNETTTEAPVKVVELVLPSKVTPTMGNLSLLIRTVASREKTSFRSSTPEPDDAPKDQAKLIRKAADRGASALIVDPNPDAEVTRALEEVREQGVPSVLMAPLSTEPSKPFPLIQVAPYTESAGKLVEAAVEDAKAAKVFEDRTAVVLTTSKPDDDARECTAALEAALKEAGVSLAKPLTYDGTPDGAKSALKERLDSDPKLSIVLINEEVGLAAVLDARSKLKETRPLIVAGFVRDNPVINEMTHMQTAAVAVRNLPELARAVFRVASRLADGEQVTDQTTVPDEFRRFDSRYLESSDAPTARPKPTTQATPKTE